MPLVTVAALKGAGGGRQFIWCERSSRPYLFKSKVNLFVCIRFPWAEWAPFWFILAPLIQRLLLLIRYVATPFICSDWEKISFRKGSKVISIRSNVLIKNLSDRPLLILASSRNITFEEAEAQALPSIGTIIDAALLLRH